MALIDSYVMEEAEHGHAEIWRALLSNQHRSRIMCV